jgi:pyruvate dehydrogenase E1 component
LIGATSGRTTLSGEGLQHLDGHSHVLASTVPTCRAYDPTFAYELAVIVHDGMQRMYKDEQEGFYYITVGNESYSHPALPEGAREGIVKGMYKLQSAKTERKARVQLLGSGAILREVIAAVDLLEQDWQVAADVWSVTSFNELAREGDVVRRQQRLHPGDTPPKSYVTTLLESAPPGPVVAATDYMKLYADQIRAYVPRRYSVLGTDGFGRSDTRDGLRRFFEVDRFHVVVAALEALAEEGSLPAKTVQAAIEKYGIDTQRPHPAAV